MSIFTEKYNEDSEKTLISHAANGCLEAFNQLVLHYQNKAYYHAFGLLGDPAIADDITQESFIKAFMSIRKFRGGSFRSWLFRIVTNTAYDYLRQIKRHPTQSLFPEDDQGEDIESPFWLVDQNSFTESIVEQNEVRERVHALLSELPEIHRSVITLVDLYDMDYWEVAEILDIPLGTVKSRLARARLQMRRKLQAGTRATREPMRAYSSLPPMEAKHVEHSFAQMHPAG